MKISLLKSGCRCGELFCTVGVVIVVVKISLLKSGCRWDGFFGTLVVVVVKISLREVRVQVGWVLVYPCSCCCCEDQSG